MKVANLTLGRPTTIEVEAVGGSPLNGLEGVPARVFQPTETADALLVAGAGTWSIRGVTHADQSELDRVLERGRPLVAWVASALRGKSDPNLMVQIQEFSSENVWTERVELGVDDALVESLRRSKMIGVRATIMDALRKLEEWFLFPSPDGAPVVCAVSTLGHGRSRIEHGVFSLHGRAHSADVQRDPDGGLRVERVTRLRRSAGNDRDPFRLMRGEMSFVDATVAGALRPAAASELDELVRGAESYLRRWSEYNEIERRHVLARARRSGVVRYDRCTRTAFGDWRFHLESGFDPEIVRRLGEGGHDDLAASAEMPPQLHPGAAPEGHDGDIPQADFVGQVVAIDPNRGSIDLRSSQGIWDDRQPPKAGFLSVSLMGDAIRLRRREAARDAIVSTSCPMPQLGLLLEGRPVRLVRARQLNKIPRRVLQRFPSGATDRQLDALRVAMNTPDIALIQGPPGTGKTDVIAALEAWLAEEADTNGGLAKSMLLTSYQHDAVDNAASRSTVLDLPALRIGGRRGPDDAGSDAVSWADALADTLRADLDDREDGPLVRLVRELQDRIRMYALAPLPPDQTATLLEQVADSGTTVLSSELRDRLLQRAAQLRARRDGATAGDEALERAVRALRTTAASFSDDGPLMAGKLIIYLRRGDIARADDVALLEKAASLDEPDEDVLAALEELRGRLLDRLANPQRALPTSPTHDDVSRRLLAEAAREATDASRQSRDGIGQVISQIIDALENDPQAVIRTLGNYTAVLAATCQQSAGKAMALEKDTGVEFDTVIVDEAARANPLDLMIPLAQARRRIVLVGDQRQLPHVLEPEVERELDSDVADETRAALRQSLFERLFEDLKARERAGEPQRVVTLDTQFRMNPVLGDFVSRAFYEPHGTELKSGRPSSEFPVSFSTTGSSVAAWVDVPLSRGGERSGLSKSRPAEADWIAKNLTAMLEEEPFLSFGVISFYSAQVRAIERALEHAGVMVPNDAGALEVAPRWRETRDYSGRRISRLRVGTVDAFQGREFDVVLLSMTRSSRPAGSTEPLELRRRFGHLMLENRLCVAMSRQKRMLMVVGDSAMATDQEGTLAVPALKLFHELCEGAEGVRVRG